MQVWAVFLGFWAFVPVPHTSNSNPIFPCLGPTRPLEPNGSLTLSTLYCPGPVSHFLSSPNPRQLLSHLTSPSQVLPLILSTTLTSPAWPSKRTETCNTRQLCSLAPTQVILRSVIGQNRFSLERRSLIRILQIRHHESWRHWIWMWVSSWELSAKWLLHVLVKSSISRQKPPIWVIKSREMVDMTTCGIDLGPPLK